MADVKLLDRVGAAATYEGVEEVRIPSASGGYEAFRKNDYKVKDLYTYLFLGNVEVNGESLSVIASVGTLAGNAGAALMVQPSKLAEFGIDISNYSNDSTASICTLIISKKYYALSPQFLYTYDESNIENSFWYTSNCRMVWIGAVDDIAPIALHPTLTGQDSYTSGARLNKADGTTEHITVWAHSYEPEDGKYTLFYCGAHFGGNQDSKYANKPLFAHFTNTARAPKKGLYACVYYDADGVMEHYTSEASVGAALAYVAISDLIIG